MKLTIWTEAYRPFILGGDVHAPIRCEVECEGPFDLGKGFQGYLAISLNGKTFIVEAQSGGIVGNSLEDVRKDVTAGDKAVIEKQIEDAKQRVLKAEPVSEADFWRALRAGKVTP